MLEERELILATRVFAKENTAKSWAHTLSTLLLLLGSIAGALFLLPLVIRIFCSLLTGFLLLRMFIIYHDFQHKAVLKGSWLARILFTIFGFYTLNPPSVWKRSHDYHHKHNSKIFTSSIGSFPIVTTEKFLSLTKGERFSYLFIRHPLTIAAGYLFAFAWGMCLLPLIRKPAKHWDAALAIIFHFGIGFSIIITFEWTAFFLGFLIPAILSSAMGSYLFYAQHNFPTGTLKNKNNWTYAKAALDSSSYMKMNPFMRWFTGNIGYHHIHHINALIPFYRLPEVHKHFPEFQNANTTSLHPREIIHCLQLKLWDPELNRMIKLNEITE